MLWRFLVMKYRISFQGKPEFPVSYSPKTGKDPMKIEADTIDDAANIAKDWYINDLILQKQNGLNPLLMEEDQVATIHLMSDAGEIGFFDFETLTNYTPDGLNDILRPLIGESDGS